jgi:tRNA A-37 threonylcarbamoyl transferase component Bud32/tetratricopeptide (TPR) repeat protein
MDALSAFAVRRRITWAIAGFHAPAWPPKIAFPQRMPGSPVKNTPEQQWSALSALYEEADALPPHALSGWLARLEATGNPLLPQLKRMLEARAHLETDNFLGTLPRLASPEPAAAGWAAGRRVGPYRLVRPLGEGGMAEVWLADRDDGILKRRVAVKLPYPRPGRESFAVRFERERNILATLRHPHIAGLFDAGVTRDGQAWLALEYVEGQTIAAYCDERRLPLRERVQLFRQVLLAVQHAHANLVIHRDLKPANILVTAQGEARLLDFGIAKLLEAEGDAIAETELTREAGRALTLRYASPEQLTGLPLTTACDVYALGVVFYELMCGERPYERADSASSLERAILEVDPRAPSRRHLLVASAQARATTPKGLRRQLAPELDAIALRCLAKKPAARYSSVDALLADVDRWLNGEAVLARSPGAWYRLRKFAARHRLGVGLGAAAIVSLAVTAGVAVVLGLQAREESARAGAARDFMLSLFKQADREKSRGADVTAREILSIGRNDLLQRLADQPRLQGELLMGIGSIQRDMGEYFDADKTFEDAARVYAALGMPRDEAMARASHANVAVRMGHPERAKRLLDEAQRVRGLPSSDHELNARLAEVGGWIAVVDADGARARELFSRSRAEANAALGPFHTKTIDALRGLVSAERLLGNFDAALKLQDELERTVAQSPDKDPRESVVLAERRADLLDAAGRYAEALFLLESAIPSCVSTFGMNYEYCRRLVVRQARVSLKLGIVDLPGSNRLFLEQLAQDVSSPILRRDSLIVLLRIDALRGTPSTGTALLETVLAMAGSTAEADVNPLMRAQAAWAAAEFQIRRGETTAANRRIDAMLAELERRPATQIVKTYVAIFKTLKGASLLRDGQPAAALPWFVQAREDTVAVYGRRHPMAAMLGVNSALALGALGRYDEASRVIEDAQPVLQQAMGQASPNYRRVEHWRAELSKAAREGTTFAFKSEFLI